MTGRKVRPSEDEDLKLGGLHLEPTQMKSLPSTDVVIIGGGWTGLLMAKELGARTPLSVVVLERGGPRKPADYIVGMDELDYFIRLHMMQDASRGDGDAAPRRKRVRSSHPAIWRFSARLRHRRHRRTLGSGLPSPAARMFPALFENRRKVRREETAGRPLDAGLGHYLRRLDLLRAFGA